jgi:hypothetical protein
MFFGGITCYQSVEVFSCNDQVATILYFFFSVFYSIALYMIIKPLGKRSKPVLVAFILKPNSFKLAVMFFFVSSLLVASGVDNLTSAVQYTSIYILPFIIPAYLTVCLFWYLTRIFIRVIFNK